MIIQAISLLDQLDKDINTFSMRAKYVIHWFAVPCVIAGMGECRLSLGMCPRRGWVSWLIECGAMLTGLFCFALSREWNSYCFPELAKLITDNYLYARVAKYIGNRATFKEDKLEGLETILGDTAKAKQVVQAAKMSMGMDVSDMDMANINMFLERVIELSEYRMRLHEYLVNKMDKVCISTLARTLSPMGNDP
jgi:RNA processing factor Prp31